MEHLAVVGDQRFVLGFQLAGIAKAFSLDEENPDHTMKELVSNREIGLILIDEKSVSRLSDDMLEKITGSIRPIVLTIGEHSSNEEMRQLIQRSIGVDLWDK